MKKLEKDGQESIAKIIFGDHKRVRISQPPVHDAEFYAERLGLISSERDGLTLPKRIAQDHLETPIEGLVDLLSLIVLDVKKATEQDGPLGLKVFAQEVVRVAAMQFEREGDICGYTRNLLAIASAKPELIPENIRKTVGGLRFDPEVLPEF